MHSDPPVLSVAATSGERAQAAAGAGPPLPTAKRDGWLRKLGPGIVTGAADDDPSGIGTYSQTGAQYGYALAWTMVFTFPLMAAFQEICGRIGAVTGAGLAENLRRHYPIWLLRGVVLLLLVANVINLGADLGAMGSAAQLLLGGREHVYTVLFGVACVLLQMFMSYARYASFLKWLTLSLFTYVAVVLVADVDWSAAAMGALVPALVFDKPHVMALLAVLGTTISPYLFFWQSSQEAEEGRRRKIKPLDQDPDRAGPELKRIRIDTLFGMGVSNLVALSIILATAATLNAKGVTDIQSSAQAAEALRPVAGDLAFALFATGIVGTGLLAVPILAGSATYAVCEMFGWRGSLESRPRQAKAFYATIAVATMGGVALDFTGIDPMKALVWSAAVNGILAAPVMIVIMLISSNAKIMGSLSPPVSIRTVGWLATALMTAATLSFLLV